MTRRPIDEVTVRRARRELAALAKAHPELTSPEAQGRLALFLQEDELSKDATLTEALYLRVAPEDIERLDGLVARIPIASRNAIAREAMRLGLAALEKDPAIILRHPLPKRGGRRK